MWIKKAEITSFGKWRQQTFLFEAKNQLVYGLNEAGKSTLYQFIQAILFGFPRSVKKVKIIHRMMAVVLADAYCSSIRRMAQ